MKRFLWLLSCGLVIGLAMAGCNKSAEPEQITFSDAEMTSIASTVEASAQQTALAVLPTPPPSTSTPQISTISGTSLVIRADQTALFMDHRAGIELVIPAGWLPVRVNEDEYYKAFTLDVVMANPAITDRLTRIQSNNVDNFRLDVIGIRPEHMVNGMISNMSVIFEGTKNRTFEEILKIERAQRPPFDGYKYIGSTYEETVNGTRVLVVEKSWDSIRGGTVYYRRVFFVVPAGTVALDLQVDMDIKDVTLLEFQQVVDSLTSLNP